MRGEKGISLLCEIQNNVTIENLYLLEFIICVLLPFTFECICVCIYEYTNTLKNFALQAAMWEDGDKGAVASPALY